MLKPAQAYVPKPPKPLHLIPGDAQVPWRAVSPVTCAVAMKEEKCFSIHPSGMYYNMAFWPTLT